jgi:hypothetical protein
VKFARTGCQAIINSHASCPGGEIEASTLGGNFEEALEHRRVVSPQSRAPVRRQAAACLLKFFFLEEKRFLPPLLENRFYGIQ